jgi:hypothetical protein
MAKISPFMSPANFQSSFLSCEKDLQKILKKLFVESRPYSDDLKRLLIINNKDCMDPTNQEYNDKISAFDLAKLREEGYIKIEPKINFGEHEQVKAYLMIEFNNFVASSNPEFRDCVIDFNIFCHTDKWDIGDYQLRPIKIMGYIDGILNNTKLSGIGTLQFLGANEIVLDENLSGYLLRYAATHGSDDKIPDPE